MGKQLKIVDKDTGEVIENIEFSGGYNVQYACNEDVGRIHKVTKLDNGKWGNKHWIKNYIYRPIAQKLVDRYDYFKGTRPEQILFIEDEDYIGTETEKPDWIMRIKKANMQLTEYTNYKFIIESREWWMSRISREQVIALIYSMLKHIDGDSLKKPDVEGWNELIGTMGQGWEITKSPIPNLLENFTKEDFKFLKKADKQVTIYDYINSEKIGG
ncbi:putative metallopeptidase [Clostridium oceanicum]|uniref:Metallopeptidase n=1 Tax=Clostridium oceanicum TaxID=1543 RepID=A0ABP3UL67_9CLOT